MISCKGSYVALAWNYIVYFGAVTGGDYFLNENGCQPYPFLPAALATNTDEIAPSCSQSCNNQLNFDSDRHYGEYASKKNHIYIPRSDFQKHIFCYIYVEDY